MSRNVLPRCALESIPLFPWLLRGLGNSQELVVFPHRRGSALTAAADKFELPVSASQISFNFFSPVIQVINSVS